eukprot:7380451-Prymnesium_polylepis.3
MKVLSSSRATVASAIASPWFSICAPRDMQGGQATLREGFRFGARAPHAHPCPPYGLHAACTACRFAQRSPTSLATPATRAEQRRCSANPTQILEIGPQTPRPGPPSRRRWTAGQAGRAP